MRSPVNWALLGLLIERTGYGYDLFQRFERTYGGALELSCPAQIYKALTALEGRGLIERLPQDGAAPEELRQPKPHYRASAEGVRSYQDWLISQVTQERQRSELFPLQLAALDPCVALAVLDRHEQSLLQERETARHPPVLDGASPLARELVEEVKRLETVQALKWIEYARRKLEASIGAQGLEQ
jgi:DNA-binding PadR family transcriptional regulator